MNTESQAIKLHIFYNRALQQYRQNQAFQKPNDIKAMARASTWQLLSKTKESQFFLKMYIRASVCACVWVNVHPGDTRRPHFMPIRLIQSKFKSLGGRWHKSNSASSLEPVMLINKHHSAYLRMTIQSAHLPTGCVCISGSKLSDMEMYITNRLSIQRVIGTLSHDSDFPT